MIKSSRLPLLLPVLLTFVVPVVYAAPEAPAETPAVTKSPILNPDSPLIAEQFERIAKAYEGMGSFSVEIADTFGIGKDAGKMKSTAYFGQDGHLGLKISSIVQNGKELGKTVAQLYDGHDLVISSGGRSVDRIDATKADPDPSLAPQFFSPTFGGQFLGALWKYNRASEGYRIYGTYSIKNLPDGNTVVENVTTVGSEAETTIGTTTFTIDPAGFLVRIVAGGTENGQANFHAEAQFSRPVAIDSGALIWEKFGPPPNPNFSFDPAARAVVERAAKLYGETTSFSTKISGTLLNNGKPDKKPPLAAELAWERRGRVRLKSSHNSIAIGFDGKYSHILQNGAVRKVVMGGNLAGIGSMMLQMLTDSEQDPFHPFNQVLADLLQGQISDFTRIPDSLESHKVTLEAPATLYNLPCSVVKVVSKNGLITVEDRYWFAASDARLLRVTTVRKSKGLQRDIDVRLNGQQINPKLPASTWIMTAPAKAKPSR